MNDQELLNIWKSYDSKLEQALLVNQENTVEITRLKVQSQLASMKPVKWLAIVLGVAWCCFLGSIFSLGLLHRPMHLPFVAFMAGMLGINALGVGMYIYHLVLIERVNNSDNILSAQRTLALLRSSTLTATRVLILSAPFYAGMHLFLVNDPGVLFWVINGLIISAFVVGTLWLFIKIDYKNRNERWFQILFDDREWNGVIRSIEMLEQIEVFENEAT